VQRLARLRSRLVLLAAASMVPLLLLSVTLGYFLLQHEKDLFLQAAVDRNRTFMTALDAKIEGYVGTLRALGASGSLESRSLDSFYNEATRVLASQPDWRNILLLDASGQQLINLRLPYGTELPRETDNDRDGFRFVVQSKSVMIGGVAPSPTSNEMGMAVLVPVLHDGAVPYVLQCILKPEALAKLLARQGYPSTWTIVLVDANRRIIARQPYRNPGDHPSSDFMAAIQRATVGWYRGRTLEGTDTYTAHVTSALTRWTSGVAIPTREIVSVGYHAATYMFLATCASLLLAIILAHWAAKRLAEPISNLAAAARRLGSQQTPDELGKVRADPRLLEVHAVAAALEEAASSIAERENLRERERQALRAADKAKDEFLAMLGHELRNPLSSIVASAHVLRLSKPGARATTQAHEVIERQALQMARLVEDLLDVSRLAMGKLALHRERIDLAALTRRAVTTWLQTRPERAGQAKCDLMTAWIDADRTRIEQILTNLLDNAEKFSAGRGCIQIRVRVESGNAVLEVEDEGQGISPDNLTRIFELFVQGPQPFDRPQGGIGLGLTLAKRFAEMHGGAISASSPGVGRGAVFTLRLPLSQEPQTAPVPASDGSRPDRRRVLIVEDNEDGRIMMEAMLTLEGHEVKTAATGERAVSSVVEWQPDIALVDIGLPDIDGYEVARRLRALALSNPPKLIAISGFGQQSDLHRAYEAGFDLHLTKPVSPRFLENVMGAITLRSQFGEPDKPH
jgi:signal transduction histidine kinase/ActR/RegA family two-component response regulator